MFVVIGAFVNLNISSKSILKIILWARKSIRYPFSGRPAVTRWVFPSSKLSCLTFMEGMGLTSKYIQYLWSDPSLALN